MKTHTITAWLPFFASCDQSQEKKRNIKYCLIQLFGCRGITICCPFIFHITIQLNMHQSPKKGNYFKLNKQQPTSSQRVRVLSRKNASYCLFVLVVPFLSLPSKLRESFQFEGRKFTQEGYKVMVFYWEK